MLFFIIIVVLVLILIIPIPLKFKIYVSKKNYYIKFYNIDIISTNGGIIKNFIKDSDKETEALKENENQTEDINSDNKFKNKLKDSIENKLKQIPFKRLYGNLCKNKFKPKLKFNSDINYSLGDASNTAISYGLFYNINPILFYIFSIIFKVKDFRNNFNPIFKDELLIEISITSIFTFNLAKIINMLFIILKSTNKD